ncbi:uncharacterized protein LOC129807957 [Phlebotomus papatasi]|uniref:uncharacterized protein LOC129807957 n=1 Tax=Phlebotomus papatasi TaxID=29031 RepID=UPI002483B43B|nr:uncharacterized protein LOC129807957 [Phlebotomus papatasi]
MAQSSKENDSDFNLVIDLPEDDEQEQESNDCQSEEHILPDSPDLKQLEELTESIPKSAKIRTRRKTISSFNEDGNYASSITEAVKLRTRRKSVHVRELAQDDGDWVSNAAEHKRKLKERRKSIAISRCTSPEPRPAKITRRRKTMYPGEIVNQFEDEEFANPKLDDYIDFSNRKVETSYPKSTSRRKSVLKPMDTVVKFEKIVSYKNPTIPHHSKYRLTMNAFNKITNPNEHMMRRLACLKVFRQYFRDELSVFTKENKAMKKAM